jgi:hypothetical protein
MKTSIKILGILVLGFVNVSNLSASEVYTEQFKNEQLITAFVNENQFEDSSIVNVEPLYFSPSNVLATYHSSILDEIKEDNQIIDAEIIEFQPLCIDRTIEDVIFEDNQIIESTETTISYPLDFEKINKNLNRLSKSNNITSLKVEEMKL